MDRPSSPSETDFFQRLLWNDFLQKGESLRVFLAGLGQDEATRVARDLYACASDRMWVRGGISEREEEAIRDVSDYFA